MRLTQKADKEHEHLKMCIGWYELPTKDYHVRVINETPNQMYQKLGQIEDIEDELGVDLITLFRAFKNGFYKKLSNEYIVFEKPKDNSNVDLIKTILSNYGKIWSLDKKALTKKELEK